MKSNQSLSEPALLTKPAPHCDYPTCPEPASLKCSRCLETHYCSAKHQKEHWPLHKKLCVAPQKKMSAPVPPAPPVPLKGPVDEEDEYVDLCVICLVNVPDAHLRPCGHSMIYRYCTQEQIIRSQPCPICQKPISSFEFNGNEEPYLRWKEVFDVLEIVGGMGSHHNVRVHLETQALSITRSEDLVKLRALSKLCSRDFFDDPSLLVVAWRRIFEVLELAMLEETKVRGKKKKQKKKKDPRKLEILDACFELGNACA
ncbi:hypothetical protein TrLO_g14969 [Triparma laevis f. longispina]|uniref:Uncharacterized protein n=1 Tax=Triparma laevis f. longispina TaxID=1714387 RepID=A0A9W7B2A9_9STRA|nr:hypothetical protein TrLO_g14969 [Triparma laevis f. longispina]